MRLEGKTAIITGGATGIGEAICHKFSREGASVIVCGLPDDPVDDVVASIRAKRGEAVGYKGDLSLPENAKAAIDLAISTFGKIDVLVNNAGVFLAVSPVEKYPIDFYQRTIASNISSAFMMTHFAMPFLHKTKGVVLATGSESGLMGLGNNAVYGGTKAFLHGFIKGIAVEQAPMGVRANCVCPGPIDTAWTHKETGPMSGEMEKALISGTLMGRRGTPEEIANVFAFLASDEASYVTGALWSVDGGTTLAKGPMGDQVPRHLRSEPEGELELQHSKDGLRNKQYINLVK